MPKIRKITKLSKQLIDNLKQRYLIPTPSKHENYLDLVSPRAQRIYWRIHEDNFPIDLEYLITDRKKVLLSKP